MFVCRIKYWLIKYENQTVTVVSIYDDKIDLRKQQNYTKTYTIPRNRGFDLAKFMEVL